MMPALVKTGKQGTHLSQRQKTRQLAWNQATAAAGTFYPQTLCLKLQRVESKP